MRNMHKKTQNKIDEFEYGLGNKVVKAFIPTDWSFYNATGRLICIHSTDLEFTQEIENFIQNTEELQEQTVDNFCR